MFMLVNGINSDILITCKKCGSDRAVKSGVIGERQRFLCKDCGCNFRFGDKRTNEKITTQKALCILLYSMSNCSYRRLGKLLQIDHTLIYRWIREFCEHLPEPKAPREVKQLEFDELWRFIGLKKENLESLKQLIVVHENLLPKCSINVIMQH
jgi:transposase-like protein